MLKQIALANIDQIMNQTVKKQMDSFVSLETSTFLNAANSDNAKGYNFYKQYDAWQQMVSSQMVHMPSYIKTAGVIDLNNDFYTWGHLPTHETKDFLSKCARQDTLSTKGDIQYFLYKTAEQTQLVAIRALRDVDNLDLSIVGYAIALINFERIIEIAYLQYVDMDNTYVQAYLGDTLLYTNQETAQFQFIPDGANDTGVYTSHGENYLVSTDLLDEVDICLYTFQNVNALQQSLLVALATSLVVVITSSLAVLVYSNVYIGWLLVRLRHLTDIINSIFRDNVYHDDVSIDLASFSSPHIDELTTVATAYKEVYDKTNALITENLMRKLLFQEQQFIFLQSQINPRFLYNTLDTIKVLSQDPAKRRTVSELVTSLACIMRYSLSRDVLSHVAEELDIIRQYMTIQRTRFASRLVFSAIIEDRCEDIELPKMVLQPLIENAIQYSVERKGTVSHIRLRAYTKGKNLYIAIIDTGIGMPEQVRACLQNRDFAALPGHGLKNVMIRLENIFKERFQVQVRTKKGVYTAIRLCLLNQTEFRDTTTPHP